jgi:hypothetical protein
MKKYKFLAIVGLFLFCGCSNDFLETQSTQSIDESLVFMDTKNAMLAVNGLHNLMWTQQVSTTAPRGGFQMLMIWMEMMGEDLVYTYSNAQYQSEAQWRTHRNYTGSGHLLHFFSLLNYFVSNANMIMDNIDNASGPENEKNNIKGQALFYRAFGYFYLVQLWGERYKAEGNNTQLGIVMRNTGDIGPKARSTVEEVYAQINGDLDAAIEHLAATTVTRPNKSHINLHIARGLKARVLLAQSKWLEAAEMAKLVVEQSGAKLQDDTYTAANRFSNSTNTEWLWGTNKAQEQITSTGYTEFFSYMSNKTSPTYNGNTPRAIFNLLYDKITDTDVRKGVWFPRAADKSSTPRPIFSTGGSGRVANYMANKFLLADPAAKCGDVPFMRLPEMMLAMAEGYARAGGHDADAQNALYPLALHRDPQYVKSTKTGAALIDEIMIQRRVELWGEGFRFLDLKRLNLPLDRGPAPRDGYNKGWWPVIAGGTTATFVLTNWDPEASNFNMYDNGTVVGEANRYREAGHKEWQFLFYQSVIDSNPLCEQNEL